MSKEVQKINIDDFGGFKIDVKKLTEQVLSNEYIKNEIDRLNLNNTQIKKGMIILQRFHDYIKKSNSLPKYNLFVDEYGFLAEDYSSDPNFDKHKKSDNFWFTEITPLDPILDKYFNESKNNLTFIEYKKNLKKFLLNQISTLETSKIEKIINSSLKKGLLFDNLWFFDINNGLGTDFIKYISIVNGISFNKTVAIINANDLQRYLKAKRDERNNIISHLNAVDILSIYNITFGQKEEWLLEFLLEVFDSRIRNNKPILISTDKDVSSLKNKFLLRYFYNKTTNVNDIENFFKQFIKNNFIKILVNIEK